MTTTVSGLPAPLSATSLWSTTTDVLTPALLVDP